MFQANDKQQGKRVIISILGPDRVGIIASVATLLADNSVNILDISQTTLQEYFSMILIADMGESNVSLDILKNELAAKGKELGVRIDAQHEDVFNFMHRI